MSVLRGQERDLVVGPALVDQGVDAVPGHTDGVIGGTWHQSHRKSVPSARREVLPREVLDCLGSPLRLPEVLIDVQPDQPGGGVKYSARRLGIPVAVDVLAFVYKTQISSSSGSLIGGSRLIHHRGEDLPSPMTVAPSFSGGRSAARSFMRAGMSSSKSDCPGPTGTPERDGIIVEFAHLHRFGLPPVGNLGLGC